MDKTDKKIKVYKFCVALASGWLGFFLAPYSLEIDNIYNINLVWSLIFPLTVSIAWEPVTPTSPLSWDWRCLFRFTSPPTTDMPMCSSAVCICCCFNERVLSRSEDTGKWKNSVLFLQLIFSLVYYLTVTLFFDKIFFSQFGAGEADVIRFLSRR